MDTNGSISLHFSLTFRNHWRYLDYISSPRSTLRQRGLALSDDKGLGDDATQEGNVGELAGSIPVSAGAGTRTKAKATFRHPCTRNNPSKNRPEGGQR